MIPCDVCGQDISGGWSIGFPPAPDSQKMGLCRKHDQAGNKERVQRAWQELIYNRLEENNKNTAYRAGDIAQLFSIYFTGGGAISIPCSSFCIIEKKTILVITPGGENIYFPLGQVRNYALSPLPPATQPPRQTPALLQGERAPEKTEHTEKSLKKPDLIEKESQ